MGLVKRSLFGYDSAGRVLHSDSGTSSGLCCTWGCVTGYFHHFCLMHHNGSCCATLLGKDRPSWSCHLVGLKWLVLFPSLCIGTRTASTGHGRVEQWFTVVDYYSVCSMDGGLPCACHVFCLYYWGAVPRTVLRSRTLIPKADVRERMPAREERELMYGSSADIYIYIYIYIYMSWRSTSDVR